MFPSPRTIWSNLSFIFKGQIINGESLKRNVQLHVTYALTVCYL